MHDFLLILVGAIAGWMMCTVSEKLRLLKEWRMLRENWSALAETRQQLVKEWSTLENSWKNLKRASEIMQTFRVQLEEEIEDKCG